MAIVNLTLPLSPRVSVGANFPWDSPFRTEDITSYEAQAARLFHITSGSETGTRLSGPAMFQPGAPKVSDLPLSFLVNRPAAVVDIPKEAGQVIEALDVDNGFEHADIHAGDAVIVRTGWGDGRRWQEMGADYALHGPGFSLEGARRLAVLMDQRATDFLLTDCTSLDALGERCLRETWFAFPSWVRPPQPSPQAEAFLQTLTPAMAGEDWAATAHILRGVWAVLALVNCGDLSAQRVVLTCLPLFVQGAGVAPCTVVVKEQ